MVGRNLHGGIFSALRSKDITTLQNFWRWVLEDPAVTGLTYTQQENIIADTSMSPARGDAIEAVTLDEMEQDLIYIIEQLEDPELSLKGVYPTGLGSDDPETELDFRGFGYQVEKPESGKRIRKPPEFEIGYAVHKRWISALRKILKKVQTYRYKIHNEELR